METNVCSPRIFRLRTRVIIACSAIIILIIMFVLFSKPKPETVEQQIEATVTQLTVLLQNKLSVRVREKVAMRLFLADSSVVLKDCYKVIKDIDKKYSKQSTTSDDLFTKQALKNAIFQETSAILTGYPEHPKVITKDIMISELNQNLQRYVRIVDTLGNLKDIDKNTVERFTNRIDAIYAQLILSGDFENMQNTMADIDEIHQSLDKIVNVI